MTLKLAMYLLASIFSIAVIVLHGAAIPEKRCGSVDIRNSPRMAFQPKQTSDKSVPNALLYYKECTILEGDFTISMITSSNVTNEEYPVFEKLRVIGGHSLIMNYALVVYQNNDLREIGLTKLTAIKNVVDHIIDQVAGQCKNECQVEDESNCLRDQNTDALKCWSPKACQKFCEASEFQAQAVPMMEKYATNIVWVVVHFPMIHLHTNAQVTSLSSWEGEKSEWKAFRNQCHYDCPNGYQEDPNDHTTASNALVIALRSVLVTQSAMKFSKCNAIEGNLELDMRIGMESTSAEKFTEAFGEIEEISGYLLVRFSSAFMSLHMFKRLRVIHGQQLWKNTYSLVVFENQNLNQLFNLENRKMQILNGKVTFQTTELSENDVSSFSNGDKAICDEIPLPAKIVQIFNYGFMVGWMPFNTTDMDYRKFLGYQIFYKKSACSDSWNMHFFGELDGTIIKNAKGELITAGVESNTLYAVYVQTRLVNHPGAKNAISDILFVKTYFSTPDPARNRVAYALGPDSFEVQWDPHYTSTCYNALHGHLESKQSGRYQKNTPQIIHSAASNTVSVRSDDSKGPAQKKRAAANALLSSPMKIL
uniref:Receptor L-domain domain-containing protein n=1 Tax=Ditylenchus dipsaci TaxID=166011 RepID=A0A915DPI3_9BILA